MSTRLDQRDDLVDMLVSTGMTEPQARKALAAMARGEAARIKLDPNSRGTVAAVAIMAGVSDAAARKALSAVAQDRYDHSELQALCRVIGAPVALADELRAAGHRTVTAARPVLRAATDAKGRIVGSALTHFRLSLLAQAHCSTARKSA